MIVAMSVYTKKLDDKHDDDENFALKWPASWALGWAGASMEIAAGFIYLCFSPLKRVVEIKF